MENESKEEILISKKGFILIIGIAIVAIISLTAANYNLAQCYNEMVEVFNDQLEDCPCLKAQPVDKLGNSSYKIEMNAMD